MQLDVLLVTQTSVSLEIIDDYPYYTNGLYNVYLNDKLVLKNRKTNVFSLYKLKPNTDYKISVKFDNEAISTNFKTLYEEVCLNVLDFNAKADGIKDDTLAIQAAIMACPRNGRVFIPKGKYLITSLFLRDDVSIELSKNAVLIGNVNRNDYPILPGLKNDCYLGTWEGSPDLAFTSIITGINVKNVLIYGLGVIDCNAQNGDWWVNHREMRIARRPNGIFLNNCENISFQGITVKNTPSWNQHPFFSRNLKYIDISLLSPKNSPTTDGIDPESCDNVLICGVKISVGDDCIAIKSGKLAMAKKFKTPSSNITIRNSLMKYGHAGVTIGSELSGGINNINVNKCVFYKTDRGLRIKSQRGRGKDAIVNNVKFDNIVMDNVLCPLVINMMYKAGSDKGNEERWSDEKQSVTSLTPSLGTFEFNNIKATNIEWGAGYFWGLKESPIKKIIINNSSFIFKNKARGGIIAMSLKNNYCKKQGLTFINVKNYELNNVYIDGQKGEKIIEVK